MTDLQLLEKSECWTNSYPQKKEHGSLYAMVEVVSCEQKNWWYRDLIGLEFFCLLHLRKNHNTGGIYLESATAVRITKNQMTKGRNFSAKDILIL